MGQTSSQPAHETSHQLDGGEENVILEKSKENKHKRKKRKSTESEEQSKEEESARALLELKNGVGRDLRADIHHDDFAASAQLVAESSPYRPPYTGVNDDSAHARKKSKHTGKSHRNKNKQGGYGHLAEMPTGEDLYDGVETQLQEQPDEVFNLNYFSSAGPPHSQLAQYTLSLDDIDSNDEDVASLLQEYQNETVQTVPESPRIQQHGKYGIQDEFQQVSADSYGDGAEPAMTSSYQLPSLVYSSPTVGERDKRKRKRREHKSSTKENGPENLLACGEGQHALDFGHCDPNSAWLDESFNLANTADPTLVDQFPVDPALTDMTVNDTKNGEDLTFQQTALQGKLKRSSRKRKRETNQPSIEAFVNGSHRTTFDHSLSEDQQDHVLPGIEELQSRGPRDADQTQTPASKRKRRLPSIEREPTPPPKKARYKSLGNKVQRGGQKGKVYNPPMTEIAEKGGMFTKTEAAKLVKFRDAYCEDNGLTERQFNERIQSSARSDRALKAFWGEVCAVLPYRTHHSIQRYCRRQFHNYTARGKWTKEEDEMLALAVAEKGKSWKAVGEMIERMPEDCRDRYRNYHTGADYQNKWDWTDAEVRHLCEAVNDCMQAKAGERRRARAIEYEGRDMPESDTDEEVRETELINWAIVSQKIGGVRSRLQCSYKWKRLKNDDRIQYLKHEGRVRREIKQIDSGKGPGRNWRLGKAKKKVVNMLPGDKYDILQALANCGAYEEGNIPFKSLGSEAFRAVWSTIDCKTAWAMMKDEVPGSEKMSYQNVVNRLLTRLMAEESDRLDVHWAGEGGRQRARSGGEKTEKRKRKRKSAKIVETSDLDKDVKEDHGMHDEEESGMQEQEDSLLGEEIDGGTSNELSTNGDVDGALTQELEEALTSEGDSAVEDSADSNVDDELASQVQLLRKV